MLHVHRADRADHLVGALADVLEHAPDDPMTPDLVAVHSHGLERWLAQQLALRLGAGVDRRDGVCANVRFVFPSQIVNEALAQAALVGDAPIREDTDPWEASRLRWRLLELVADPPAGLDLGPLSARVTDPEARFGVARQVATLFERYAVNRPGMLLDWSRGSLVDAAGRPLSESHRWQALLWCELRDRISLPSRPERLALAVQRLEARDLVLDLPSRLSLFGLTALPASYVPILKAIGMDRDVHVFLLHASPGLWHRIESTAAGLTTLPAREDDATRLLAEHPLLSSWGRDMREVQVVLAASGVNRTAVYGPHVRRGLGGPGATEAPLQASSLLAGLQADIRADRRPPGPPIGGQDDRRPVLASDDRSIQVHSCHGRTRQVEVLRDAIGHLLAADRDLEPRDIVVMCPDVEQFAPLVHAVFGADAVASERDDAGLPRLRVRLADRSLRKSNPLFDVAAGVLELVDSRVEASRVLDLAARAPVRRRFGFGDEDLARLEAWADEVAVRWGLDADHRAAYGLPGVDANTWQSGLDRLMVGVAVADEDLRTVGQVVPYDVEGDDVDRLGRLAELLARLRNATDALARPQPIAAWRTAIIAVVDQLTRVPDRDAWQRQQLDRVLEEVVTSAAQTPVPGARPEPAGAFPSEMATSQVPLTLGEVRSLLADRLRGRPTWANHRTGDLTVCTLWPMRTVPHRVVCLLGMDDAAFPRRTLQDGDDLIAAAPRVGDRDHRTEDRQLLLDALMAATEALVVTYTGRDERTNEPRPPAVPIGELLDTLDATARPPEGAVPRASRVRDVVVVVHPLQGFDPRNFEPGRLGIDGPWSFERTDLDGAKALRAPRDAPGRLVPEPLAAIDEPVVALDDLIGFLHHPVRTFMSRRLGVRVPRDEDERDDAIPVHAPPLVRYAVGQRRLDAALEGQDPVRWHAVERARGVLPPGRLADPVLAEADETVTALLAACAEHGVAPGPSTAAEPPLEIDIELPGRRALVGLVGGLAGDRAVTVRYARFGAKDQLRAYVQLVALTAAYPDRPWATVAIGRNAGNTKAKAAWCRLGPLGDTVDERLETAHEALTVLLDLYDRGLTEPLPLYCKTSAAYAEEAGRATPDRFAAAKVWDPERYAENAEPEHVLLLGAGAPYESLLAEVPSDDECGPGWESADSRFEVLALRLWLPIIACREKGVA